MKTTLLLLLASGLPLAACAANQSVDLEFGAGLADTHQSSLGATQLGLTWYPAGRLGVEAWFGNSADDALDVIPGPTNEGEYNSWIDRMQGIGVRYRFFGDENRRLQPFARVGWARANVRFEGVGIRVIEDTIYPGMILSTLVYDRFELETSDDSIYYGIGASYALDGGWRVSAQVLHVPVKIETLSLGRTEALIGLQYAF